MKSCQPDIRRRALSPRLTRPKALRLRGPALEIVKSQSRSTHFIPFNLRLSGPYPIGK